MVFRRIIQLENKKVEYGIFGTGEKKMVLFPGASFSCVLDSLSAIEEAYQIFCD